MAADGEPQENGAGSDNSESSGASSSSPSPSPATLSAPPPIAVTAPPGSSSSSAAAAAPLPLHPHLYFQQQQQQQQRLLSLHLSSASTPAPVPTTVPALASTPAVAQQRLVTNAEPSPAPPPDRPFRDDCWSENATLTLIQAWGDRYLELNRGNLKQKHWKDVAHSVNSRPLTSSKPPKTDVQCKNRLDTLKKKYKIEKSKLVTGGAPSKWAFFDRLDELIGSSKKPKTPPLGKAPRAGPVAADGNCTTNPDGQCTGMSASLTVTKCALEEDVKPPVLFIPPQATIVVPPPLISHHVGTMGAQINHHATSGTPMNHHGGTPIHHGHHGVTPIHHHPGEGVHMNHLASSAAAMNHHVDDGAAADTASKSKAGQDMSQSSPPHNRPVDGKGPKRKREDSPFRDLARAISKFGEIYERVEIGKLQQMMVLEKQRMEFTKDLEIQRLQLFMQTQVELAKMRHGS